MSISHDLSSSIDAWLKRRRNASLGLLSRNSQVSYATVRRIASNEGTPSLETAIAISAVTMEPEERNSFLKKHFPTYTLTPACKAADELGFQEFLTSKDHGTIIALAATDHGTTPDQIRTLLGEDGLRALRELIDHKIVDERNNKIFAVESKFSILNPRNILRQIAMWAKHFNFENIGEPNRVSYHLVTEGLNDKGLQELFKARARHREEIREIIRNPENRGTTVAYTAEFTNIINT